MLLARTAVHTAGSVCSPNVQFNFLQLCHHNRHSCACATVPVIAKVSSVIDLVLNSSTLPTLEGLQYMLIIFRQIVTGMAELVLQLKAVTRERDDALDKVKKLRAENNDLRMPHCRSLSNIYVQYKSVPLRHVNTDWNGVHSSSYLEHTLQFQIWKDYNKCSTHCHTLLGT